MIVKKSSSNFLFLQIHEYNSGDPPDSFGPQIVEEALDTQYTGSIYSIDWFYKSQNEQALYVALTAFGTIRLIKYELVGEFL